MTIFDILIIHKQLYFGIETRVISAVTERNICGNEVKFNNGPTNKEMKCTTESQS